jgi:hypothetical protein
MTTTCALAHCVDLPNAVGVRSWWTVRPSPSRYSALERSARRIESARRLRGPYSCRPSEGAMYSRGRKRPRADTFVGNT